MTQPDMTDTRATAPVKFPVGPNDTSSVTLLNIPGEVFAVRPAPGSQDALVCMYDFDSARIDGNSITPAWSDVGGVINAYGLSALLAHAKRLAGEIFGSGSSPTPKLERDEESQSPILVLSLNIRRNQRELRHVFLDRYVAETSVPAGSPPPVIEWTYRDSIAAG